MNECLNCGASVEKNRDCCKYCGTPYDNKVNLQPLQNEKIIIQEKVAEKEPKSLISPKPRLTTLLLCVFLGTFGVHRFYVGKIGSGFLYMISLGGYGIGVLIDLISIITGTFKDMYGNYVVKWTE